MKYNEDELELSDKTKKELQISREQAKKGKLYSLEQIKREMLSKLRK